MSFKAHECFCYSPHYAAVGEMLRDLGSNPKQAGLNPVSDPDQLHGYRHILFFDVKTHVIQMPEDFRGALRACGALIIEIDDTLERLFVSQEHDQ
jgi:hypothetical protein